ncbi:MAG: ClpXP protease specificity-enhancing factor SspB [Myxococcales bacterium]
MPARLPPKRAILLRLLSEGMVLVHLDARCDGVKVPAKHAVDPQLRLNLSHRFASRDLCLGEDGVSCTLSFGGAPFHCRLPYDSLYAVTSHVTGESVVWREDMPDGLPETRAAEPTPLPRLASSQNNLPAASGSRPDDEKTPAPAPARTRSHLRLIK